MFDTKHGPQYHVARWIYRQSRLSKYPATTANGVISHEVLLGRQPANPFQECARDVLILGKWSQKYQEGSWPGKQATRIVGRAMLRRFHS
jgi:hypothetical protein